MVPEFVFGLFFKQQTAYEMRISDWSSDVCSSDLLARRQGDVLAELEGLDVGHLDPEAALAALEVGEQVVEALHEVLAAGFQRRAQHLRIGHHEVGGGHGVDELAGIEVDDRKSTRLNSSH